MQAYLIESSMHTGYLENYPERATSIFPKPHNPDINADAKYKKTIRRKKSKGSVHPL